jgi:quinol monooxygenase YgiN
LRQLIAAPGKAAGLLETLSRAQAYAESDAEPGCLQYRISVDPNDPHKVCVFEVYVSALHAPSQRGPDPVRR